MRPPRLTEKIYVGLPDFDARLFIIRKEFRDVPCEDDFSPETVAEMTEGCNAADIVLMCQKIKKLAKDRTIEYRRTNRDDVSLVSEDDFEEALKHMKSSVQKSDIEQIKRWESGLGV